MTTTSAWPFQKDYVEHWAYWDNLFTKEECEQIIALGKKTGVSKATIFSGIDDDTRKSNTAWLFPDADTRWMFERISPVVMSLNEKFFGFDLFGLAEGFQFTEYVAPDGDYKSHTDRGISLPVRKLSVTIQLSDDKDYEGGNLLLHYEKDPIKAPTEQGKVIVFPSYMLHEVTPVTKGTRYSLVCWVTGTPFR
jgi:PKHD-type hydroxylase